ncbi:MAG: NAD(P)-binding domain-containing protein [Gemmatimonadaceae bacterium]
MTHIAFLGTGLLGSALIEAAAKRGDQIVAWNRTIDKARALEQFGVKVAETPADAVRGATRVHLVLKDDAVVDETIAAFRSALDPNAIIVDHTTNQPALTAVRSKTLNSEGVKYLHCPVFIGPAAARQTQGTILSSGPRTLFDAVHTELARMAQRVEYLGERPDAAAVFKLSGNAFIIGISGLVSDVLSIASASDLDPVDVLRVSEFFNVAGVINGRGKAMASRNYAPSFELTMARKDVRLMMEAAGTRPLSVLPAIAKRMDDLIAEGHGADDLAIIGKDAIGT